MPTLPGAPNRQTFLLLAFLGALGLGIALAVAAEMADRTLKRRQTLLSSNIVSKQEVEDRTVARAG